MVYVVGETERRHPGVQLRCR